MRKIRMTTLRTVTILCFVALTLFGLAFKTGGGTLSAFGYQTLAVICPLGVIEVLLAGHTLLPRALCALLIFFLLTVALGRVFCAWVCPVPLLRKWFSFTPRNEAAEQDYVRSRVPVGNAAGEAAESPAGITAPVAAYAAAPEKSAAVSPYVILCGALVSSAVFGFPVFCLVCPIGLTFATVIGLWRLIQFNEPTWSLLLFPAILLLELVFLRRWCHRFCPLGALGALMSRLNLFFRPTLTTGACLRTTRGTDCHACGAACREEIDLHDRPSAAQLSRCTKCRACADACPVGAISFPLLQMAHNTLQEQEPPARVTAEKIPLTQRRTSFSEIYRDFTPDQAVRQSARCLLCGVCVAACPLHNPIPKWMALVRQGRIHEAAELALRAGCLPEICGRVCPQDRLCEGVCTLGNSGGAVTIGSIERHIADAVLAQGWYPRPAAGAKSDKRVAVVGAGPAGLACADVLARCGVQVTVFERQPEIGGLLTFGIPAFKLDKALVIRRREIYDALGIAFRLNCEIGRDVTPEALLARFDAVFIGVGAAHPVRPGLENEGSPGVFGALNYLSACAGHLLGMVPREDRPDIDLTGKRVMVLGGGDTAMDCLRTAVRQGAACATCAYRRTEAEMPGSRQEVKNAREEGARFMFSVQPSRLLLDASGKVAGVGLLRCTPGEPDETGRSPPRPQAGSEFVVAADAVIVAFGFRPHPLPWLARCGVAFDGQGRIRIYGAASPYCTANTKIFAGGDAVRGPDRVATAIADGRHAAQAIAAALSVPPVEQ